MPKRPLAESEGERLKSKRLTSENAEEKAMVRALRCLCMEGWCVINYLYFFVTLSMLPLIRMKSSLRS